MIVSFQAISAGILTIFFFKYIWEQNMPIRMYDLLEVPAIFYISAKRSYFLINNIEYFFFAQIFYQFPTGYGLCGRRQYSTLAAWFFFVIRYSMSMNMMGICIRITCVGIYYFRFMNTSTSTLISKMNKKNTSYEMS